MWAGGTLGVGFHTSYFSSTTAAPWPWAALQSESCVPILCWWMGWQHRGEGRVCESGASPWGKPRGGLWGKSGASQMAKGKVRGKSGASQGHPGA